MNPDWVYLISGALFGVWMERHNRWKYFWWAVTGKIYIKGTRGASQQGNITAPAYEPIQPGGNLPNDELNPYGAELPSGTPQLPEGVPGELPVGGTPELGPGASFDIPFAGYYSGSNATGQTLV